MTVEDPATVIFFIAGGLMLLSAALALRNEHEIMFPPSVRRTSGLEHISERERCALIHAKSGGNIHQWFQDGPQLVGSLNSRGLMTMDGFVTRLGEDALAGRLPFFPGNL